MSIEMINLVIKLPKTALDSYERLVLFIYANFADPDGGRIFPSTATVAEMTSLSKKGVTKIRDRLIEKGYLVRHSAGGGRSNTPLFSLDVERLKGEPQRLKSNPGSPFLEESELEKGEPEGEKGEPQGLKGEQGAKKRVPRSPDPLMIRQEPSLTVIEVAEQLPNKLVSRSSPSKSKRGQTPKRDPRLDHPAIQGYQEVMCLHVPVALRDKVIAAANNRLEEWVPHLESWLARGYNPRNIAGILDSWQRGDLDFPRKTDHLGSITDQVYERLRSKYGDPNRY